MFVSVSHGILTRRTDGSWPRAFADWLSVHHPAVRSVVSEYWEWPLPRLAAIRNLARVRGLVQRAKRGLILHGAKAGRPLDFAAVGHSNGCVLAFGVVEAMIGAGIPVRSLVLMAPALRTCDTSRAVADWINRGMLGGAVLVRPTADRTIGLVSRFRVVTWPWGSLGLDGWDESAAAELGLESLPETMVTIDLPAEGHSDLLALGRRAETFSSLVAPALGLGGGDSFFDDGRVPWAPQRGRRG